MHNAVRTKKSVFLLFIFLIGSSAFAQVKVMEVTHYIFPEFTKGTVLMKAGVKNEASLNYNSLSEEMIFESNGKKLALGQLDLIDTVYIKGRKFIPLKGRFVEIIYNSTYALYAELKCKVKDPGKPAAYGGTSQTSSTTSYSSFFSGGQVYELKLPEGYETSPFVEYWLKKDGELTKFLSIRQLSKMFDESEDLFKEYVRKNNVKYDNQASIVHLIRFLETNK